MKTRNGIVKVFDAATEVPDADTFTVMGDPGCDGLGVEIMNTFARALSTGTPAFSFILGDIVPIGKREIYEAVKHFVDTVATCPVYPICGNHDTAYYDEFYGMRDYVLYNARTVFIILDNSRRMLSEVSLAFLKKNLEAYSRNNIVVMFHIPPPNSMSTNSMDPSSWINVCEILKPYKRNLSYILCGHVHTFFEDTVDDMHLVVSAGAGARLEPVQGHVDPLKAFHHVLKFSYHDSGKLYFEHISLDGTYYDKEIVDPQIREFLEKDLAGKCEMFVASTLFAHDAHEKGLHGLAHFFRATAESALYHARNHFTNLNRLGTVKANLGSLMHVKQKAAQTVYTDALHYTQENAFGLARYSFYDMDQAEKAQISLYPGFLAKLTEGKDIAEQRYFVCNSCGYTAIGGEHPVHCPLCGAPADKIHEVISSSTTYAK
ncbi:MAG: metallophosphoesterase [Endomicrobiales bacterium]